VRHDDEARYLYYVYHVICELLIVSPAGRTVAYTNAGRVFALNRKAYTPTKPAHTNTGYDTRTTVVQVKIITGGRCLDVWSSTCSFKPIIRGTIKRELIPPL